MRKGVHLVGLYHVYVHDARFTACKVHADCPLRLSDFKKNWNRLTIFRTVRQYNNSWGFVQEPSSCSTRTTEGQTDGQNDCQASFAYMQRNMSWILSYTLFRIHISKSIYHSKLCKLSYESTVKWDPEKGTVIFRGFTQLLRPIL